MRLFISTKISSVISEALEYYFDNKNNSHRKILNNYWNYLPDNGYIKIFTVVCFVLYILIKKFME